MALWDQFVILLVTALVALAQAYGGLGPAIIRRHGYSPVDTRNLANGVIQLPVVLGLYAAIRRSLAAGGRFLWMSNLAQPDVLLSLLVGMLTYLSAVLSPSMPQQIRMVAALLPALLALYFVWSLASGLGLYWATFAAVGTLESGLVRRFK